jgi:hypothetical protein
MLIAAGRWRYKRDAVRLAKLLDKLDFSGVTKTAAGRVKDADGVMEGVGRAVRRARDGEWEAIETLVGSRKHGKAATNNG